VERIRAARAAEAARSPDSRAAAAVAAVTATPVAEARTSTEAAGPASMEVAAGTNVQRTSAETALSDAAT
jgi:hypothetical protein